MKIRNEAWFQLRGTSRATPAGQCRYVLPGMPREPLTLLSGCLGSLKMLFLKLAGVRILGTHWSASVAARSVPHECDASAFRLVRLTQSVSLPKEELEDALRFGLQQIFPVSLR